MYVSVPSISLNDFLIRCFFVSQTIHECFALRMPTVTPRSKGILNLGVRGAYCDRVALATCREWNTLKIQSARRSVPAVAERDFKRGPGNEPEGAKSGDVCQKEILERVVVRDIEKNRAPANASLWPFSIL